MAFAGSTGETLPHPGEHDAPPCVRVHVTPLFVLSSVTVALNCAAPPTCTEAVAGETETKIAGRVTVIVTEEDLVGSATEVAVTVTERFVVTWLGAV